VLAGHKVYVVSGRTSLHLFFGRSCYRHLCCSMLVVGVTSERDCERGRKGSQISYAVVVLKTTKLKSYAMWLHSVECPLSRVLLGPSSSWLTSSFYRPRWGSAVDGSFEKVSLYCDKTGCLTSARPHCPYAPCCLVVFVRPHYDRWLGRRGAWCPH
jgi:hypothetical protein